MPRGKRMKPPLRERVLTSEVYQVTTIHLRFHAGPEYPTSTAGWGTFHIDEARGSLVVESDWGNYAYCWGHGGRSRQSLREFLATCSEGYIATKLLYGHHERVFDEETTRKEMKKIARTLFREGRIIGALDLRYTENAFQAFRELTEQIHEFCRGVGNLRDGMDHFHHYDLAGELLKKAFDPIYEHIHTEMPAWHQVLHQDLVPAFQAYLRGEISGHQPPPESPASLPPAPT